MKKIIVYLSLFFNLLILLSSFTKDNSKRPVCEKPKVNDSNSEDPKIKTIGFKNIISSIEAQHYKDFYKSHFRGWYKKVPESIWFTREVYEYLGDFFNNDTKNEYDGIRIFFMQYDKPGVAPGGVKNKRISICMVPTKNRKEHWDSRPENKVRDYIQKITGTEFKGALDHGEICPQKCTQ
jgi:hypothetical protein